MGVMTEYELEIRDENDNYDYSILAVLRDNNEAAYCALDKDGEFRDSCKWYNYSKELKEFSKKYPEHLFILKGEGEECTDMWIHYFKNGKDFKAKAIITFPEFNESKLK